MARREPLGPKLVGRAFSVANARAAGVSEGRLRSADLAQPFYGVRAPSSPEPVFLDSVRAFALRMRPGQFFSHATAARLWGVPLETAPAEAQPLHVSSIAPARPPRTRGMTGHQLRVNSGVRMLRHGLPVADPALTWLGLATTLRQSELVAAGDYFVLDPVVIDPLDMRPYITLDELTARVTSYRGPGKQAAARALPHVRIGAESRPESLLRLILINAGLPEPELNVTLTDGNGRFIGRVDMYYPLWRVVVEYDGDHHRTSTPQYEKDMLRREKLARANYPAAYIRKYGVFTNPASAVDRVRTLLLEAGWRP